MDTHTHTEEDTNHMYKSHMRHNMGAHRKLEIAQLSPQPPVSAASEQLLVSLCSLPCFLLSCCTGARDRPGEGWSSTAGPLSSITQRSSLHNTPLVGVSPHSLDSCRLGHVQVALSLAHRLACMTSHDITHKSPYTLTCHHSPKLTDKGIIRSCYLWLVALLRGAPRGSPLR